MIENSYADAITAHYTSNWSTPRTGIRWGRGPIDDLPPGFQILVIRRSPEILAYGTVCMSQPQDEQRLELHLLTRSDDDNARPEMVELLTVVAHYHRTGQVLGLGHSVNFGRPWLDGSLCTHGIISLPYLDGPKLELLAVPAVRFLWLIPVTEAEVQFKKEHGMTALEDLFEQAQFDYLDPQRSSVV